MGVRDTGCNMRFARWGVALAAWLIALAAAADTAPFDLQAYRLLAASDRAAGIAQGRAALDSGVFGDDTAGERQLLWYMGGAAIGMPDDVALGEVVLRLQGLGAARGDSVALAYADFLRGARMIDLGDSGDGLATTLRGANRIEESDDPQLRATAASELCRAFSAVDKSEQALAHCRRYTSIVRPLGDSAVIARAEYLEAVVLSRLDRPAEAIPLWQSARERFLARGLGALADRAAGALASDLISVGRGDDALALARVAERAGRDNGNAISTYFAQGVAARALLALGRGEEGASEVAAAIDGIRALHQPAMLAELLAVQAQLAEAAGDAALAQRAQAEIESLSTEPISDAQGAAIATLEQRYVAREQALRIRELEQQNEHKAAALEQSRAEAQRRAEALRDQRLILVLAVLGCVALVVALASMLLLWRAQRRIAAGLRAHAYRDALTGLGNRRALFEAIDAVLAQPDVATAGHCLILVDVDRFKAINDRGGHPFGDQVLIGIAAALHAVAGTRAQVCRLGGEEFALLCPRLGIDAACALAEAARDAVRALRFDLDGGVETVSVSLGVAPLDRCASPDATTWVQCADRALYEAKSGGRDRVVVAEAALP